MKVRIVSNIRENSHEVKHVSISWICEKQISFSRSSTDAEPISLDTALRMDEIPALDLWHQAIEVFYS